MLVHHARPIAYALAVLALALGLAACTHHGYSDPGAPATESAAGRLLGVDPLSALTAGRSDLAHAGRMFYPLVIGNRWDYDLTSSMTLVTSDGPQPPEITHSSRQSSITGKQLIGDREYFLQLDVDPNAAGVRSAPTPLREDRSGLYTVDLLSATGPTAATPTAAAAPGAAALRAYVDRAFANSPRRAAFQRAADELAARLELLRGSAAPASVLQRGGPGPGELAFLRYPLYVGARWTVRESPRFSRIVVARERVALPAGRFAAWRIRGTSELFGPNDRVTYWYSSAGLLRLRIHGEADAVDDAGNVVGRFIVEQDQSLTALHLVAPGDPSIYAVSPGGAAGDE